MEKPPADPTAKFLTNNVYFVGGLAVLCLIGSEIVYRGKPNAGELRLGFLVIGGIAILMIVLAKISQAASDARYFAELAAKSTADTRTNEEPRKRNTNEPT